MSVALLLKSCIHKDWEYFGLVFREFPGAGDSARFALSTIT